MTTQSSSDCSGGISNLAPLAVLLLLTALPLAAQDIEADGKIKSGDSLVIDGATDTITAVSGTISFDNENLTTTGSATAASLQITGLNCTGNMNGGALTTDASGNLSCSDDDAGGGATTPALFMYGAGFINAADQTRFGYMGQTNQITIGRANGVATRDGTLSNLFVVHDWFWTPAPKSTLPFTLTARRRP